MMLRYTLLAVLTCSVFLFIGACSGGDDDDGGPSNAAPILTTPNATGGDIVIGGSAPNYTGICETEDNLTVTFIATDTDATDTLTTTISVTGGTLTAAQAGFAETFPYTPASAVSPHAISLSGTAGSRSGSIELTVDISDGNGGTDQLIFTLVIKAAFDFNADGYNDVIASTQSLGYIFLGSASPAATTNASAADVRFSSSGTSAAPAGDINGDGYDDVIVGNSGDSTGGPWAGAAAIIFGSAAPPSIASSSVTLIGEASNDSFGISVSTAGDVDGDGYADVIIGANGDDDGGTDSGCAFIFFGSSINTAAAGSGTIDASNADVKLVGEDADDRFGTGVSEAGDVNNDGSDDVIVGAFWDDDGGSKSGCAFIFFGSTLTAAAAGTGVIDASAAAVKLIGGDIEDWFGESVSAAGDLNGDGYGDVIVGAILDDNGGTDLGCAFVFFGSATPLAVRSVSAADMTLVGDTSPQLGKSVGG